MYKLTPPKRILFQSTLRSRTTRVLLAIFRLCSTTPAGIYSYTRIRAYARDAGRWILDSGFSNIQHPTSTFRRLALFALITISLATSFSFLTQPAPAAAATTNTVNFQARLMNATGSIVADGNYNVEFKLYNAATSTGTPNQGACTMQPATTADPACLWTETRTSADVVTVANGYLTVNLGSVTNFPSNFNWGQQLYLSMRIGGTGVPSWDTEMSPRLLLTAVPAAYSLTQYNTTTGFSSNLQLQAATVGDQNFVIQNQGAAGTYNICIQSSSACGFVLGSGTAFVQGGNSFTTTTAGDLGTNNNGVLNLRTNNATRLTLGTSGDLTFAASNTITTSAANGSLSLVALGSGTATVDTGSAGTVALGVSANNKTINIGNVTNGNANTTAVNIATSTGAAQTIKFGGTGGAAANSHSGTTVTAQGGATALNIANAGATIQNFTAAGSATAFQVQNASSQPIFLVDTTNTTNKVVNPGFETGTTGWAATGTGASIAQNTAAKQNLYHGLASLDVTLGSASPSGAQITSAGLSGSALTPGTYTLSFYAKGGAAISGLAVTFTGGTITQACTLSSTTVSASGFNRYSCTFIFTTSNITAVNITATTLSQHMFLDAVQIQSGSSVTPYYIGAIQLRGVINNPVAFQATSDSTNAFQIQNSAGTSNLFVADTLNGRVGIGTTSPTQLLSVNGASTFAGNLAVTNGGITATGTIQFSTLTTNGVLHTSAANGTLAVSAVVLTSEVSGILPAANGGTGNGFTAFSGPTTSTKTFTLPDASATILTNNALVTAAQGGTGNGFTQFSGPAASTKTFTLPNASATILTDNATVTAIQGGTGQNSYAIGDLLTGDTSNTLSKIAAVASGSCLISQGVTTKPIWGSCAGSIDLQTAYANSSSPATITSTSAAKTILLQSGATFNTTGFLEVKANGISAPVLSVDTANQRVGIGTATPGYALDVVGDINASVTLKVAGSTVCDSTGCSAAAGGGNYIRNATAQQTGGRFNIKASVAGDTTAQIEGSNSATAPVAIIKGGTSPGGAADLLQLQDSSNILAKFSNAGALTLGRSGAGTNGQLILNNSGNANAVTLSAATSTAAYNFILPGAAGSSGDCLKNGGTPGTLTFAACGSTGITTNLQNAYDNSSTPANILTSAATKGITITAGAVHTVDIFNISNTSQAITANGVNALSINYLTSITNGANENAAVRIDHDTTNTTAGASSGLRYAANATGPATTVTKNGIKLEGPTTGGAGTYNAINIANIGATTTGGAVTGIKLTPTNSQAAGNVQGINIGSITAGGATETAIVLGAGWDNLLTYNGTSTFIINGSGQLNLAQVTGTLVATNGGTGQNTYAVGDLLVGDTSNTLSKIAAVAGGSCLISQGTTTKPIWGSCGSGSGDSVTVNGSAATDANFLNTTATGSVAGTTWSLNTGSNPDDVTLAVSVATGSVAGVVDTNAQTFGGAKTFSGNLTVAPANSATAFRVQNGGGISLLTVDSTANQVLINGNLAISQVDAPSSVPTLATGGAGSLTGTYYYAVTYATAGGESSYSVSPSPPSITVTSQQVSLTNIPISPSSLVSARKVYRSTSPLGPFNLVATINDNTTTSTTDNNTSPTTTAVAVNQSGGQVMLNGARLLFSDVASLNTAFGVQSFQSNTSGLFNTAIGATALQSNTTGSSNTANGYNALQANTTGGFSTAMGTGALKANTTGASNSSFGYMSLQANLSGNNNVSVGNFNLANNTTGSSNTATGNDALRYLKTLSGSITGTVTNGGNARFTTASTTGLTAGASVTISGTTSYNGAKTVLSIDSATTFTISTAYSTADAAGSWTTATPDGNTAAGFQSGKGTTNGYAAVGNSLYGYATGSLLQTGADYNSLFGYGAGDSITTGKNNTLLGYLAGQNLTTGSNNIIIGQLVDAASATGSNQLNIGNLLTGDLSAGTAQLKGQLTLGTAGTTAGTLVVSGSTAGTVTLNTAANFTSYSMTLASTGATGSQCLQSTSGSTSTATILQWGSCGSGGGDSITVNSTAATDANFLNTTATGSVAGTTWSLNTGSNPDDITLAVSVASGSVAGVVDTNAQTFGGTKTFSNNIVVGTASSVNGSVAFNNSTNANQITLQAPSGTAAYSLTLPGIGASGQQCAASTGGSTTSATVLSWINCSLGQKITQTYAQHLVDQAGSATTAAAFLTPTTTTAFSLAVATTNEVKVNSAGSFRSCTILNSAAVTGGTVSVRFRKNGANTSSTAYCGLSTTAGFTRTASDVVNSGVETFAAGDTIGVALVSSGLTPAASLDFDISFTVEFDSGITFSSQSLQAGYTGSTGSATTPEIKLDSTRGALDIQDADTTIGGNLLNVRAPAAGALGNILFSVTSAGQLVLKETTAPTGTSGFGKLYVSSTDNKLHLVNSSGVDTAVGSGGGGGTTQTIKLIPEYSGGTLHADGTNNAGSMTSDYSSGLSSGEGYKHNYYDWSSSNATAQDYDILVNAQIPSGYTSGLANLKIWGYASNTTNATATIQFQDVDGTNCYGSPVSFTPSTATTWEQKTVGAMSGCSFAANDIVTITIHVSSASSAIFRVGELSFDYTN